MSDEPAVPAGTAPSVPGQPWTHVYDAIFGGLNHALSNLVMGMDAAIVRGGAIDPGRLRAERDQLDRLLRLYRLMESSAGERAEALLVPDVALDAIGLMGQHAVYGGVRVEARLTGSGGSGVAAVSAPRRALTHAILVLLHETARHADLDGDERSIFVQLAATPTQVQVIVGTVGAARRTSAQGVDVLRAAPALLGLPTAAVVEQFDSAGAYVVVLMLPALRARRAPGIPD